MRPFSRQQRFATASLAVAIGLVAAGIASAHGTQFNYAQGRWGAGGTYQTNGYNHRHYNQVWHEPGYLWRLFYYGPGTGFHGLADGTSNPTRWGGETGYAIAYCANDNDNSGTLWTCQTTG